MTKEEIEHNHIKEIAEKYIHESWGTYLDLNEVDLVLAGIGVAKIISKEKDGRIEELEKENELLKNRTKDFEEQILGVLIKYEDVYKRFPDLKDARDKAEFILKENAELKEKVSYLEDNLRVARKDREYLQLAVAKGLKEFVKDFPATAIRYLANEKYIEWLTKAKTIIKDYIIIVTGDHTTVCSVPEENRCINVLKLNEQAEQFLKEC